MGTLIVISGPPGAGKSSVASVLAVCSEPSVVVEGDAFFGFLATGAVAPWLPESEEQNAVVTRAAASAAGRFAEGGYRVVYDGVVGPWFLSTFAAATGLDSLEYVVLLPPVETCVARVHGRADHGFRDEAATRKMHAEFAAAPIPSRHVLDDPPGDVASLARRVLAALDRGDLTYRNSPTVPPRR